MADHDILGPFPRSAGASLDEALVVCRLLEDLSADSVMLDVGAHFGGSLIRFAKRGWRVLAFEPDPSNRQKLSERLAQHKVADRVVVDSRACSEAPATAAPYYVSEESTGISGLSAFRETHREAEHVVVTTLETACEEHGIEDIDFLKVDTEGYDLPVLRGLDWGQLRPRVILCEFEDSKTVPLGYRFHDLGDFLLNLGYTVFVSEWHPVTRYGVAHDWHRLAPYPCELSDPAAWGNFLAFRDPQPVSELVSAARSAVTQHRPAPRTSVIMPAFNEERHIGDAIESLCRQDDQDWELLIVDDGSTDGTQARAQAFVRRDPRIRLLSSRRKGVSAARNTGLDEARGRFIAFLDADDAYGENALIARVRHLEQHPMTEAVFCNTEMTDEALRPLGWRIGHRRAVTFRQMQGCPFSMNAVMVRANALRGCRFPEDLGNGEDWLFWSRLARMGLRFEPVGGCHVLYRQHPSSTVISDFRRHESTLAGVLRTIYGSDPDCPDPLPEYRDGLSSPPLERILLQRRFSLLLYSLFDRDWDGAEELVHVFTPANWADEPTSAIVLRIKFGTMRFFICPESEWRRHWQPRQARILAFLRRHFPADQYPNMGAALDAGLSRRSRHTAVRERLRRALAGRFSRRSLLRLLRRAQLWVGAAVSLAALVYAGSDALGAHWVAHLALLPLLAGIYLRQRESLRHANRERLLMNHRLRVAKEQLDALEALVSGLRSRADAEDARPTSVTYFFPGRRVG